MTERGWGVLAVAIAEMLCPKDQSSDTEPDKHYGPTTTDLDPVATGECDAS